MIVTSSIPGRTFLKNLALISSSMQNADIFQNFEVGQRKNKAFTLKC